MKANNVNIRKLLGGLFVCFLCVAASAQSQRVVVIDSSYPGKAELMSALPQGIPLVELQTGENPWAKIRTVLAENQDLRVVDLFTQSEGTSLRLAGKGYDISVLEQEFELAMLEGLYQGEHLQLLLYDCTFSNSETGRELLRFISSRSYMNIGVCTNCSSILDETFTFDFTTMELPVERPVFTY